MARGIVGRMKTTNVVRCGSLILVGLSLSTAGLLAQQPAQQTASRATAQAPSSKIVLDVVVTPNGGVPVPNLQRQDFILFDNKTAQSITSFRALSPGQEPTKVILVLDAVNTSFQTIASTRPQIDKFLRANEGKLAYPTSLVVVTDTGVQVQPGFSSDGNALSASLDEYAVGLRNIRRSAGFYGAEDRMQISLQALSALISRENQQPGRKIILWISPGWPLLSGPGVQLGSKQAQQLFAEIVNLSTQLRQNRITLYSVDPLGAGEGIMRTNYYKDFLKGVQKPSQVEPGDLGLQVLVVQSGGQALASSNDIAALLQTCMADTTAYYELTFEPPPADRADEYHHLQVQLNNPHLTGRTLQGYYSQPYNTRVSVQP
jgi:VWFA-related protein